ncbi:MAG: type II toxin-antitoxin system HicA family toxin [Syntrophobacterales bacterium]|jgi:predicted RNA binding protein YcfA (HicA-like mRNA interferase family)|nr:type II toxin-antitoxin system HicA family toxin [Syntrophobacterales bacterium]
MVKKEKLIERLKSKPKDFTFDEMRNVLESLGFEMFKKGKTSGSRVAFFKDNTAIILHKPHPRKELLEYQIKQVLEVLEKEGLL